MKRTKLKDRVLPNYTKGEEIFNMVTHIVGAALGVALLIVCIFVSVLHYSVGGVLTSVVYGVSLILLYTMSSIYHGLRSQTAKKVFQIIDHCTIYILISGTYTPVVVCGLTKVDEATAWVIFGVVWGLSALAITLNAVDLKKYKAFSMTCYLVIGWCIIFAIRPTYLALTPAGFWWLLAGGVFYTIGSILYGIGKKKRYMHSVFHIFVLLGTVAHAVCILFYVL